MQNFFVDICIVREPCCFVLVHHLMLLLFFLGSAAVLGMATSTICHNSAEAICTRTNSGMFASNFGSACRGHKQS
jgi:hypothetical protein